MLQANTGRPPQPDPRARLFDLASPLTGRRFVFAGLVLATTLLLMGLATHALAADGLDALDVVLLALFLVTLPWTVIGFWNAAIGFVIMRFARNPAAVVTPAAARIRGDEAITASVALMACIRNEPPARVIRNLAPMLEGLAAAGVGNSFHLYVLSDTGDTATAAAEAASFADLTAQWCGRIAVIYRRRDDNSGYKAGNIRDFCERFGAKHEFAVTLDADSFIPAFEKRSGTSTTNREELRTVLDFLRKGDVLMVTRIDRLGRRGNVAPPRAARRSNRRAVGNVIQSTCPAWPELMYRRMRCPKQLCCAMQC
jgi:membrane glycosyltransferase